MTAEPSSKTVVRATLARPMTSAKRSADPAALQDRHPSKDPMTYSIESTVRDLLDNAATKSVVEKHLPGLSSHPQLGMARGMSLSTVAQFSGGQISEEVLQSVDAELRALG